MFEVSSEAFVCMLHAQSVKLKPAPTMPEISNLVFINFPFIKLSKRAKAIVD